MRIVMLGLSITSSWGNGHATNYRALGGSLRALGHDVLFLERDKPWYASNRDFVAPWIALYDDVDELHRWSEAVRRGGPLLLRSLVAPRGGGARGLLRTPGGGGAVLGLDTPGPPREQ